MDQRNRYSEKAKKIKKQEKANKHINFVVIAYVVILFYLLTVIYLSFTKESINYVIAEPGIIHDDGSFAGLILRQEKIVFADDSGPITYFVPEGQRVREGSYICAINQDPDLEELIRNKINGYLSKLNDTAHITDEDYEILQNRIKSYVINQQINDTTDVYSAREIIEGTVEDISKTVYVDNNELYEQIQNQIAANESKLEENGTFYKMQYSGVVSYAFDGFEKYSITDYDLNMLNEEIVVNKRDESTNVLVYDPIYKIIDNHKFYIVTEIDPYAHKYLETKVEKGNRYNALHFPRKKLDIDARIYDLIYQEDKYYAVFEIDRYFDAFFEDRFIDFVIQYDDYKGIKIPNEAVTTKHLFQVPESAVFEEKGNSTIRIKMYSDEDVSHETLKSVSIKVYYKNSEFAYVQSMNKEDVLKEGDSVLYTVNTTERISETEMYILDKQEEMEGVYVLNRGYTDFRRIITLYESDAFRIVEAGVGYSIGLYDKVASDASEISEFVTLN